MTLPRMYLLFIASVAGVQLLFRVWESSRGFEGSRDNVHMLL